MEQRKSVEPYVLGAARELSSSVSEKGPAANIQLTTRFQ